MAREEQDAKLCWKSRRAKGPPRWAAAPDGPKPEEVRQAGCWGRPSSSCPDRSNAAAAAAAAADAAPACAARTMLERRLAAAQPCTLLPLLLIRLAQLPGRGTSPAPLPSLHPRGPRRHCLHCCCCRHQPAHQLPRCPRLPAALLLLQLLASTPGSFVAAAASDLLQSAAARLARLMAGAGLHGWSRCGLWRLLRLITQLAAAAAGVCHAAAAAVEGQLPLLLCCRSKLNKQVVICLAVSPDGLDVSQSPVKGLSAEGELSACEVPAAITTCTCNSTLSSQQPPGVG